MYIDAACEEWSGKGNEPSFDKGYCQWDTSCERIKNQTDYEDCYTVGIIYTDKACTEWSGDGENDPSYNEGYCQWIDDCRKIKNQTEYDICFTVGFIYNDEACTEWSGDGDKDPTRVVVGCCNWGEGCFAVYEDEDEWKNCPIEKRYETCINDEAGTCPVEGTSSSSSANVVGESSSSGESNNSSSSSTTQQGGDSSSSTGTQNSWSICTVGDKCLTGPFTFDECKNMLDGLPSNNTCPDSTDPSSSSGSGNDNTFVYCIINGDCFEGPYTLAQCHTVMGGLPTNSCPTTPIILPQFVYINTLSAMQNAVNLNVTNSAVIQVFDLKGNAVRTLKFARGNYVVPLSGLPNGLYIVKASSASWKQTITVPVK
ncbi:MAG: T9SS type A sorting domain-containing protein [Fibromonadaceae bacterium]|nr:T9SS type A sorting domain-containing protein [Fibromonadaceae bacterium]